MLLWGAEGSEDWDGGDLAWWRQVSEAAAPGSLVPKSFPLHCCSQILRQTSLTKCSPTTE